MPSTACASCLSWGPRPRSSILPASLDAARSVRRTPAWLLSVGGLEFRRVVSSTPYSPAEAGARQNTHRVAGPVRPQPATATPVASSDAAGCRETDPTGVATVRLAQEWVRCFFDSLSDALRRLNELNRTC